MAGEITLKQALATDSIQKRFAEMLGKKSAGFLTSLTNVVQNSELLQKAEVPSIILAAGQAAALDLPINPNLGLAAIIPFKDSKTGRCTATFQIMRDGWMDLCLRTGQFVYIANEPVYKGELVKKNRFTGEYVFDEDKRESDEVIGYMAAFKLNNGYEKTVYWTVEEAKKHGMRFSQTFKRGYGLWKDDFHSMALKSVLKHLLKKYAPKSIELITAIESDQAAFKGDVNNLGSEKVSAVNPDDFQEAEEVVEAKEIVDTETGEIKPENAEENVFD